MVGRRGDNRIRGPKSALTDFLASNNISAQQIRDDYNRRRDQATAESSAAGAAQNDEEEDEDEEAQQAAADAAIERSRKRKRAQDDAISDIKNKKDKSKSKKSKKGKKGGDDDSDIDGFIGKEMYKKAAPKPGQLENCEICEKRFTVTPYSKSGPNDGLLCTKCGKDLAKDVVKDAKPKKSGNAGKKRRKVESDRMDGKIVLGARSLENICIEKLSTHPEYVNDLGGVPERLVDRLGQIFTKNRLLKPHTLPLFIQPDLPSISIHDCAYLESQNYNELISGVPDLEKLVLGNACQFKDANIEYLSEKAVSLKHLHLYAANLVSNEKWTHLIETRGPDLRALKLQWLDASFEDEHVAQIAQHCLNLERLKLERCRRIGEEALSHMATMPNLKHLSLQLSHQVSNDLLLAIIDNRGPYLETLSLEGFKDADDSIVAALKSQCTRLKKLRIRDNDIITDAAFADLFTDWKNGPLRFVDLSATRDVDNNNPNGPEDPVGLSDASFQAMMKHSGSRLEYLDISSCRHITNLALQAVFSGEPKKFPELKEIDMSFVGGVDTVVLAGLFRSCPKIVKVVAFGCFNIKDIVVPRGVVVIGVPCAQDAIENFGNESEWAAIGAPGGFTDMTGLVEEDEGDVEEPAWMRNYMKAIGSVSAAA